MGNLQRKGRSIVALTDELPTGLSDQDEAIISSIMGSNNHGESMVTSLINHDGFQSGDKAASLSLSASNENLVNNIMGIADNAKSIVPSPPPSPTPSYGVIIFDDIYISPKVPTLLESERAVIDSIMKEIVDEREHKLNALRPLKSSKH